MFALLKGRYRARIAETDADVTRAQMLRTHSFRGAGAALDADDFDAICAHVLVEEVRTEAEAQKLEAIMRRR